MDLDQASQPKGVAIICVYCVKKHTELRLRRVGALTLTAELEVSLSPFPLGNSLTSHVNAVKTL